jgi:Glyoxalase-like domain
VARLKQIVIDCQHPASLARFWSDALEQFEIRPYDDDEIARLAALGFTPESDPTVLVDGPQLELCFQQVDTTGRDTKRHLHFDIDTDKLDSEVLRLVDLGAQVVERFDSHVWMRDPEQNDFCLMSNQLTNEIPPAL